MDTLWIIGFIFFYHRVRKAGAKITKGYLYLSIIWFYISTK